MVTVLRPLSTSELLDRTFHLYRNNFVVFVGITAIPQLVVLALQLASAAMIWQHQVIAPIVIAVVAGLSSYVSIEIAHAATVMAVSNLHLDRPATIQSSYSLAKGSMLRVVGISLAVGLAIGAGFLLLIVPGIYLALAWSLAIPVTVLEGGGLNDSVSRSSLLSKGSRGRIFVVGFLMLVLTIIVTVVIDAALMLTTTLTGIRDPIAIQAFANAVQSAGGFVSTCLVGPLATIALTLIYYDQRVRKEGFDLQFMMATLQSGQQTAAAGTV